MLEIVSFQCIVLKHGHGVLYDTAPVFPNKYTSKKVNGSARKSVGSKKGRYLFSHLNGEQNALCTPLWTERFEGQGMSTD